MSEQKQYFDFAEKMSQEYEKGIRITNPAYEQLFTMSHGFLRSAIGENARLLVVGAGGGMELLTFGRKEPGWCMTGVDPSAQMVCMARNKVRELALEKRTQLVEGMVSDLPSDGLFDAATCLLVLHFLADDEAKLSLLQDIASRLKPGAPLVLASLFGQRDTPAFERCRQAWEAHLRSLNHPKEELILQNYVQLIDTTSILPEKRIIRLLGQAGFTDVSRFYTAWMFGGWVAVRRMI